ncbi:unnamed protein product [Cochlearia groenlandica]
MMSIFSPIDALYAELEFGEVNLGEIGLFLQQEQLNNFFMKQNSGENNQSPATEKQINSGKISPDGEENINNNNNNNNIKKKKKIQPMRIAPEIDGVHCFETILPF